VHGTIVARNGKLCDRTIGMSLLNVETGELLMADLEESFEYGDYATCPYT
jgi:hypothetical protein